MKEHQIIHDPKLIIVSAPSGAGKTTIVRHLLSLPIPVEFSVSATSRSLRSGEVEGKDYYFLSPEVFKYKVGNNEFLEWEEVYPGTCYGTLNSEVERIWNKGKSVIFDVDVVGGLNIKSIYGEKALAIFVQPPSVETLRLRLRSRSTETDEKIDMRIAKAEYELGFAKRFDVILVNDKLEDALCEVEKLVRIFLDC